MLSEFASGHGAHAHGCQHYERHCHIKAVCCQRFYPCRRCHDQDTESGCDTVEMDRKAVQRICCQQCGLEQLVSEGCLRCGCRFGKYFCPLCRMFDDQLSKGTWHCHGCGICRVGGKEAFTHCDRCRVCYTNKRFEDHTCVEDAMGRDCPVCLEFLHTSTTAVVVPKCGHILHRSCYDEVLTSSTGRCPVCSRTYQRDLKRIQNLDAMIEAEPMPEGLRDQWVQVLCNDCQQKSWVGYHVLGHKV
ncbi:uncharacterized protein MONBRDRAFT_18535 [Monosiga brevicollis MX1]|uniref:RING finger and CHY zinc finger domain-containing protein 1 n=1 Tax=Monosiga brevicollis TaxID=81824 RepID=A9UWA5_MONBE|nr:uncharacterized protein MONBRDRAFT_18535 [Monosiga brevicollis MX1]EDQ90732.1 predicted protein [Monosiga brevicollis MX1]|eukprot:XP_001744783.1 hypothetical protein [Monosiga brevicollis MX1]